MAEGPDDEAGPADRFYSRRLTRLTPEERAKVEANLGLIGDVIRRQFPRHLRRSAAGEMFVTYEDIFDVGVFGLVEALSRWEPARGAFSTCAEVWIRNKIQKFIAYRLERIRVPKWVQHAKLEKDGATEDPDEKRRLEALRLRRVRGAGSIGEAEHAARDAADRRPNRRALLALLYAVPVRDEEERLGRMVAVKIAGLDGGGGMRRAGADAGTDARDETEAISDLAAALGVHSAAVRRAYDAFRRRVAELQGRRDGGDRDLPRDGE